METAVKRKSEEPRTQAAHRPRGKVMTFESRFLAAESQNTRKCGKGKS
jgi:hypothetical protein